MERAMIAVEQGQLTKLMKNIMLRNLPLWVEELKNYEISGDASKDGRMSYEEFLAWTDEDTLAEWEQGEVIMSSPASLQHQNIGDFLLIVLRMFVEHHDLGVVLSAPFQMKLENGREPDILYVANAHMDRLKNTYLDGPADVVVEIVSPESLDRDRGAKFLEYETGEVAEYWLLDPIRQQAEFYQLSDQRQYAIAFSGKSGIYRSQVLPEFWLRVEWLWQSPLPDVARTAWTIIGVEGLRELLAEVERESD